jgi:hypothetical protein
MTQPSRSYPRGRIDVLVFGLTLILAAVCSGAGVSATREAFATPPSASDQVYQGVVTDTRCGAKHSTEIGLTASDCTIQCIRMGEQFALVDGDTRYILDGDSQILKRVAGQRVKISGSLTANRLEVKSVTPN